MKAVTWQGKRSVSIDEVPDPEIQEASDAIIRVTTTNICGSDLHLYETLGMFMDAGDILGHEPMRFAGRDRRLSRVFDAANQSVRARRRALRPLTDAPPSSTGATPSSRAATSRRGVR
jgi:hypothetical protein